MIGWDGLDRDPRLGTYHPNYQTDYRFRRLSIQFTPEQMQAVNRAAEETGKTRSAVIKEAVQKQLVKAS